MKASLHVGDSTCLPDRIWDYELGRSVVWCYEHGAVVGEIILAEASR